MNTFSIKERKKFFPKKSTLLILQFPEYFDSATKCWQSLLRIMRSLQSLAGFFDNEGALERLASKLEWIVDKEGQISAIDNLLNGPNHGALSVEDFKKYIAMHGKLVRELTA